MYDNYPDGFNGMEDPGYKEFTFYFNGIITVEETNLEAAKEEAQRQFRYIDTEELEFNEA